MSPVFAATDYSGLLFFWLICVAVAAWRIKRKLSEGLANAGTKEGLSKAGHVGGAFLKEFMKKR